MTGVQPHHFTRSFIIALNSAKSISPSPFSSTSLITSLQTLSSIFLPTPNASFNSSTVTAPLPSLSKNPNEFFSYLSSSNDSLLAHACINSCRPSSPLPSTSTAAKTLSHSSYPSASPYISTIPARSSLCCSTPSPLTSSFLNVYSSLFCSSALIILLTIRHKVACYSFCDTLKLRMLPKAPFRTSGSIVFYGAFLNHWWSIASFAYGRCW